MPYGCEHCYVAVDIDKENQEKDENNLNNSENGSIINKEDVYIKREKIALKSYTLDDIEKIKEDILNKNIPLNISEQKQNRHIEGKKQHEGWKSILTVDGEEIIKKYAGKGTFIFKNDVWKQKEFFVSDKTIGFYINSGKRIPTNKGMIVYSKSGVHIYPINPKGRL